MKGGFKGGPAKGKPGKGLVLPGADPYAPHYDDSGWDSWGAPAPDKGKGSKGKGKGSDWPSEPPEDLVWALSIVLSWMEPSWWDTSGSGGYDSWEAPAAPSSKGKGKYSAPLALPAPVSTNKLFVGGLPKVCSEEMVRDAFEIFGVISDVKMMLSDQGESKGFCFVTFALAEDAQRVLENFADNKIDGKWVDCKAAQGPEQMKGGGGGKGKAPKGAGDAKAGDWWCPGCGDLVFAWRDTCNMCGHAGAGVAGAPPSGGSCGGCGKGGRPGDWICGDCGDLVFSSRNSCNKCGSDKPSGTQRIGMKHGDWTCPGCGDLVFASKHACSLCGAEKPAGDGGAPTASGGFVGVGGPAPKVIPARRPGPY
mmetsp:Transcript_70460/g.127039  ORF Transcript_70460/g.127039 Transcript_70460/m.127039 type:complete len:365 (-) Transcript_70460:38-1132(-)